MATCPLEKAGMRISERRIIPRFLFRRISCYIFCPAVAHANPLWHARRHCAFGILAFNEARICVRTRDEYHRPTEYVNSRIRIWKYHGSARLLRGPIPVHEMVARGSCWLHDGVLVLYPRTYILVYMRDSRLCKVLVTRKVFSHDRALVCASVALCGHLVCLTPENSLCLFVYTHVPGCVARIRLMSRRMFRNYCYFP